MIRKPPSNAKRTTKTRTAKKPVRMQQTVSPRPSENNLCIDVELVGPGLCRIRVGGKWHRGGKPMDERVSVTQVAALIQGVIAHFASINPLS